MAKKLKGIEPARGKDDNHLARAIHDSAEHIWLAGLGAFSKAQRERTRIFEALVKEGQSLQQRTMTLTEKRIDDLSERTSNMRSVADKQASDSWDRLEQVFEDRVARALSGLGIPSSKQINDLIARVDELSASVEALGGKRETTAPGNAPVMTAEPGPKTPARAPTATASASARKSRARKAASVVDNVHAKKPATD